MNWLFPTDIGGRVFFSETVLGKFLSFISSGFGVPISPSGLPNVSSGVFLITGWILFLSLLSRISWRVDFLVQTR